MARPTNPSDIGGLPPTDVTPANLAKRGGDFHDEQEALADAMAQAMTALAALGPFWGDDESGRLFYAGAEGQKGFRAATEEIVEHGLTIQVGYRSIGDKLAVAGVNVAAADWATISGMVRKVYDGDLTVPTTKAKVT
ncbi:hypothetical protein [Sphaerisporangium fuscum]|uniref:hypothetical protein n=1 Tax=Sphaerisporangium fuscum TaxID=2835868 RepID=UPI001BDC212E|nr:hypothetical protein [Sphaerisporangium fuscum]